jgi:hypothetical protein
MISKITFLLSLLLSACVSTTMIKTIPSAAKISIDGMLVGRTPHQHSDNKFVGSTSFIELKKDGCQTKTAILSRTEQFQVGPFIGGIFVWFPFLWVMGYNPERTYELECGT